MSDLELPINRNLTTPWALGFNDRGLGHGDYGILNDATNELLIPNLPPDVAKHIVELHNASPFVHADGRTVEELQEAIEKAGAELAPLISAKPVSTEDEEARRNQDGWELSAIRANVKKTTDPTVLRQRLNWIEFSLNELKN